MKIEKKSVLVHANLSTCDFFPAALSLSLSARRARKIINRDHFKQFPRGFLLQAQPAQHHTSRCTRTRACMVPHARHRPHRTRSTRRRCPGPFQHCCKRQVVLLARDPKMVALQPWSGGVEQRGGRRRRLERHPWLETARVAVTPTMRSQTACQGWWIDLQQHRQKSWH